VYHLFIIFFQILTQLPKAKYICCFNVTFAEEKQTLKLTACIIGLTVMFKNSLTI